VTWSHSFNQDYLKPEQVLQLSGPMYDANKYQVEMILTTPISLTFVIMTTIEQLCSHSIRQKSSAVSVIGP